MEAKLDNLNKDELKYFYVYTLPNTYLNKAQEVNVNVNTTLDEINSYFESLDRVSKKRTP